MNSSRRCLLDPRVAYGGIAKWSAEGLTYHLLLAIVTPKRYYAAILRRTMLSGLVLLFTLGYVAGQAPQPPPPGMVEVNLGGPPIRIHSSGYPNRARKAQEVVLVQAPTGSVVNMYCFDVRVVSQLRPQGPCSDFVMLVIDGNQIVDRICDQRVGYSFTTKSNLLIIDMRSGQYGISAFKCELKAVKPGSGSSGALNHSPFFSKESTEVDSAEHGGPPGRKPTNCKCGWSNKPKNRIVGGDETMPNEFPFAVALMLGAMQFCGGTILTQRHVVTAAHCTDPVIKGNALNKFSVIAGAHDLRVLEAAAQMVPVERIIQHAQYDDKAIKNDISLLLVKNEFRFADHIGPACLLRKQQNLDKSYIKIIGWGMSYHNGPPSPVLKDLNIRSVPLQQCAAKHTSIAHMDRKQICTHSINQGACMGDSGGPVVWVDPDTNRYTLVGLVSFGRICASSDPSVHTDVTAYIDWIENSINQSAPSQGFCSKTG